MLNKELISAAIPTLNPDDRVAQALDLMAEYNIRHLPIVSGEKYLGLVSEEDLMNADDNTILKSLDMHFMRTSANAETHFIEAVQAVNDNQLSLVPVVDKDQAFVGVITLEDLLKEMGKMVGVAEPGAIIILQMEQHHFSFSELSKLVETNDAHITQLNTSLDANAGTLQVTLKINKFEVSDIIATFQRYDYQVKYYFGEELYENELRSNYDHLMNYLNI